MFNSFFTIVDVGENKMKPCQLPIVA